MQLTIQEILDGVKAKVSFVYDAIYPHYNERVEGVVLDVDWWLAQDLGVKLERKRLIDAMRNRSRRDGQPTAGGTRDMEAVQRAVRNKPEAIVRAVNDLPEAERKAIRAQINETFEPTKRALEAMKTPFIADVLNEAAELIRNASDLTEEDITEIRSALDNATLAFTELLWKVEAQS